MARAIEKAFADKRHLIVEAGTGTGKTLAYLLPALRLARERQQRIIISTGTKNLQEQLFFKDIPFLESVLGPLKVCYMKGRNNYLCKHKLYALRDAPLLTGLDEIGHFHAIAAWEKTTATGDRAEIDALPEYCRALAQNRRASRSLPRPNLPRLGKCSITAMRRKAVESEIVIVNHHIFFADMAIKLQAGAAPDAGVLPAAAVVIFDEAHEIEDVASKFFGISLGTQRFDELARALAGDRFALLEIADEEAHRSIETAFRQSLLDAPHPFQDVNRHVLAAIHIDPVPFGVAVRVVHPVTPTGRVAVQFAAFRVFRAERGPKPSRIERTDIFVHPFADGP